MGAAGIFLASFIVSPLFPATLAKKKVGHGLAFQDVINDYGNGQTGTIATADGMVGYTINGKHPPRIAVRLP